MLIVKENVNCRECGDRVECRLCCVVRDEIKTARVISCVKEIHQLNLFDSKEVKGGGGKLMDH
jgi:hypothetical protein